MGLGPSAGAASPFSPPSLGRHPFLLSSPGRTFFFLLAKVSHGSIALEPKSRRKVGEQFREQGRSRKRCGLEFSHRSPCGIFKGTLGET